jgi:hypothetical protein
MVRCFSAVTTSNVDWLWHGQPPIFLPQRVPIPSEIPLADLSELPLGRQSFLQRPSCFPSGCPQPVTSSPRLGMDWLLPFYQHGAVLAHVSYDLISLFGLMAALLALRD